MHDIDTYSAKTEHKQLTPLLTHIFMIFYVFLPISLKRVSNCSYLRIYNYYNNENIKMSFDSQQESLEKL